MSSKVNANIFGSEGEYNEASEEMEHAVIFGAEVMKNQWQSMMALLC